MNPLHNRYHHLSRQLACVRLGPVEDPTFQALPDLPEPYRLSNDTQDLYLNLFPRSRVPDLLAAHHVLDFLPQHPEHHRLQIASARTHPPGRDAITLWVGPQPSPDTTLLELTLDRELLYVLPPFDHPISQTPLPSLNVEWLLLQDPFGTFTPRRPRAPGQRHPSAGAAARIPVAMKILGLLHTLRRKLGARVMVNLGEFFHNAEIFSRAFQYADPEMEGIYQAALRDIMRAQGLDRIQASWAFDWGLVRDHTGRVYRWPTELQISPDLEPLTSYFACSAYLDIVQSTLAVWRFTLDREAFDARWPHAGAQGATGA